MINMGIHILFPFHFGEFNELKLKKTNIYLFKDYLLTKPDFKYHKLKLAWNESICNAFAMDNNIKIIDLNVLKDMKISGERISIFDPLDFDLLEIFNNMFGKDLDILELNSSFMLKNKDLDDIYKKMVKNDKSHLSHKVFFDHVKNNLDILKGVKSTDLDNRESIKKLKVDIPKFPNFINKGNMLKICEDAIKYVNDNFSKNPGIADNLKHLPICKKDSILYFNKFIKGRLNLYGKMQDAIDNDTVVLFHSHCSYLLNVGLLTPKYVIDAVIKESDNKEITINNIEGFIRQVLGWREYMRFIYHFWGKELKKEMILLKGEALDFNSWYNGKTGILPIDNEIKKIESWAWSHHIIRLMMFLNFMKLNEIRVYDIYKWFITFVSLDAFEWVMVSNIMAMGFYNKRFMRRGYTSSSNYILKMSNYKKDGNWDITWDNLYRNYVKKYGRFV